MAKKVDPTLMAAAEKTFWETMDQLDHPAEERYYVVDKRSGDVIVHNARLTKEKKKIEV